MNAIQEAVLMASAEVLLKVSLVEAAKNAMSACIVKV
jgi:hypothetical protein